jgi:hypothetical protein
MLPTLRKYTRQNNEVLPRKLLRQILEALCHKNNQFRKTGGPLSKTENGINRNF